MADSLLCFADAHAEFEMAVQKRMAIRCRGVCSRCDFPCCRPVFCREALDSPFLNLVRHRHCATAKWSSEKGWLGPYGCILTAGRPVVCYEFNCAAVMSAQPAGRHREALQNLAQLLTRVGRNALGKRHILEMNDLVRINSARLEKQLVNARTLLGHLEHFWRLAGDSG